MQSQVATNVHQQREPQQEQEKKYYDKGTKQLELLRERVRLRQDKIRVQGPMSSQHRDKNTDEIVAIA